MKAPRCKYCQRPCVIWWRWRTWFRKWGQRQSMPMYWGACQEHSTCMSFLHNAQGRPADAIMHGGGK